MLGLNRRALFLLALVTALALCLRLYRLDEIPPGLHHDEALNGIEAHDLLTTGERPIYIGSGFNGEPLLEYSIMLSEAVFGMTAFAVRLPSALFGALTIPAVFLVALEIFQRDERRVTRDEPPATRTPSGVNLALASSFIVATLYWHLNASREGYKPVLLPLFGALTFWLLLRVESGKRLFACGVVLGLGAYTYPSIRFLYPVVALFFAFMLWRERPHWRAHLTRALVIAAVALIVFAPLGIYYVQHPDAFFTRQNQVGVWVTQSNGIVGALADNMLKVAGMFFVRGDLNPRQDLPARPALDAILAVGFVIGLARALWHWKQPANFLLLTWLAAMLVPSIVTEAAPNFLRSLGAVVPTVMLVVIGYDAMMMFITQHAIRNTNVVRVACCVLLLFSAALSLDAYFNQLPRDPRAWYGFDVGLVKIGEIARALPSDEPIYLTPISSEQATIEFTLGATRANFKWFDGRKCLVAPPSDHTATLLVVNEDFRTAERVPLHWPDSRLVQTISDYANKPYLSEFQIPAHAWNFVPQSPHDEVFGKQLRFVGYTLVADHVASGQGIPIILFWRAQQPIRSDYTIFTHLLGAANPRTNTPLWGQNDHRPCAGGYPTTRWSVGEIIAEDFLIVVDKDAPAASYALEVGAYELDSGARLTLPSGADRVMIGPVEILNR